MSAAGRRVGQLAVDWTRMATRITEEGRARFNQLRSRYEICKAGMNSYPEKPQPIDWSHYQQNVSVPGLVESFQKQFEATSIPYPKDTTSASIDKREIEVEKLVKETLAKSEAQVKEWEAELATLKAQKPFEDMTIDEYIEQNPDVKKLAEESSRKMNWQPLKD